MKFDADAFGEKFAEFTATYVERQLAPLLTELFEVKTELAALKAVPAPKDGRDGVDGVPGEKGDPGERGADGAPGINGESGPAGRDGADGLAGKDGAAGLNGKDGASIGGGVIDREGVLQVTLTDGKVVPLGIVVGKDGTDGKDGRDGLGFDDLEVVDDGATFTFRLARGDHVKEWTLPKPTLADFFKYGWKEDTEYSRGSVVMWAGQPWLAMADSKSRPDTNADWTYLAKKARDGRDGELKAPAERKQVKL